MVGAVATGQPATAMGLARMRYDGTPDPAFGTQGTRVHDLMPGGRSIAVDAVLQADGTLLVAGWVNDGIDVYARPMLCRFTRVGALDGQFGDDATPGCRFFLDLPGRFNALLVQDDGRILAGGSRSIDDVGHGALIRLHSDGSTDTTFGSAGLVLVGETYSQSSIHGLAQTTEGQVLATGRANIDWQQGNDTLVMRLDGASGTPDVSFGPDGIRVIGVGTGETVSRRSDVGYGVHAFPDGSVLVTGSTSTDYSPGPDSGFSSRPFAMKFLENGELDSEFGGGIRVYNPCPVFAFSCAVDAGDGRSSFVFEDGRFVIAGAYRYTDEAGDFFAMRLLPNGDLDTSFGLQMIGQEAAAFVDFALVAPPLSLDGANSAFADGERIVLAGHATTPPTGNAVVPDLDFALARLDHGLDQMFAVSPQSVGNGTLSPALQQMILHSDHVEFAVVSEPDHMLASVEGCGGALHGSVYTTGAIVGDCAVTATFVLKPPQVFADGFEP